MASPAVKLLAAAAGGAASAPAPPVTSGLYAHYAADYEPSITESSGAVSQWDDLSGNGKHLVQATGTAKPTTGVTTQNGRNVLDFDGGDRLSHTLESDWTFLSDGTGATVFIVAKAGTGSDPNARYTLATTNSSATSSGRGIQIAYEDRASASKNNKLSVITDMGTNSRSSSFVEVDGFTPNTFHSLAVVFNQGDSYPPYRSEAHINGGTFTENPRDPEFIAVGWDWGAANVNAPLAAFTVGMLPDGTFGLVGSIAEILVYDRRLTPLEIYDVEVYLADRWDTPAPADSWIDLNDETSPYTVTYTGGIQHVRVPTGVTTLTVDAYGGQGGNNGNVGAYTDYGGEGGRVKCDLSVTAREVLRVYVGGRGYPDTGLLAPGTLASAGYNGGGTSNRSSGATAGGGGGGSTDIRVFPFALADREVVGPGGGGQGGNGTITNNGAGDGATPTGGTGANGSSGNNGGAGGTSSAGGSGGTGTASTGTSGSLFLGGAGQSNRSGGGGGSGLYGGGGGGGTNTSGQFGGAGGGGSGLSTGVNETLQSGVRANDGQMILSW